MLYKKIVMCYNQVISKMNVKTIFQGVIIMQRKATSNKLIILGVDGMDPKLTKKYIAMGLMPNTENSSNAAQPEKISYF